VNGDKVNGQNNTTHVVLNLFHRYSSAQAGSLCCSDSQ